MPGPDIPPSFDPTHPDHYVTGLPDEQLAQLRKAARVSWIPQRRRSAGLDDEGYWAVTRHADIQAISKNPEMFSSWENTAIVRFPEDIPRESIELQRYVLLNMDPPQHTKLRGIVSRGFTSRAIGNLRDVIAERAHQIVRRALERESGNFVADVASELPLQAITELLGVPQDDRSKIFDWSNRMIRYDDKSAKADDEEDDAFVAMTELLTYSLGMAEDRRGCPRDDIATKLVAAQIDGQSLGDDEFGFFVLLLAAAGGETTRSAITQGMLAFFDHPGQWELFKDQRPETTADEIVRWATPNMSFQRTATSDTELGGQRIKQGDRLVLLYRAANFDDEVFKDPHTFDISRHPNPHLSFGGSGPHYCLGASLAKLEVDVMFNAIADLMPDIRRLGDPVRIRSGWFNGIKELPVSYR